MDLPPPAPPGLPDLDAAPPAPPDLLSAVAARHAGSSRFERGFVLGKLRGDPATAALLALARARGGLGRLVDLGCGRGQLSLALLLAGLASEVEGLDRDGAKLAAAARAARGLPARYRPADLARDPVPEGDTVLLVDVIYQMPREAQRDLLARAARAARRRVVLRSFDPDRGWRTALGLASEHLGRALRRDGARVEPMTLAEVAVPLEAAGLRVSTAPCWRGTPFPLVLVVGERG